MTFSLTDPTLAAQAMGESGGNPNIGQHYGSNDPLGRTAGGLFGFTTPTWAGMIRNHPELGLTMAGKNDPTQQQRAYPVFQADNSNALQRSGVTPNPSLVSLASFLGPTAAAAFAKAQPGEKVSDVLTRTLGNDQASLFMRSNPTILTPTATVGDVIAHNDRTHVNPNAPATPTVAAPGAGPSGAPASPGMAPSAAPMPADFAQNTAPPAPVTRVDTSGHDGDGLIATGMAMMGGNGFRDSMAKGSAAYDAAAARAQALAMRNAEFQDTATKRDIDAPQKAAETAALRAQAWNASQAPTTLTAQQSAQLQIEKLRSDREAQQMAETTAYRRASLGQDADQFKLRQEQQDRQFNDAARTSNDMIVPGDAPGQERTIRVTAGRNGTNTITDLTTGQTLDRLPAGAQLASTYNAGITNAGRQAQRAGKDVDSLLDSANAGTDRVAQIDRAIEAAGKPGANTGPDALSRITRAVAPLIGLDTSDQSTAAMTLSGLTNAMTAAAAKGQGAISDSERRLFASAGPQMDTPGPARDQVLKVLRDVADRDAQLGQRWLNAPQAEKNAALQAPGGVAEWKARTRMAIMKDQEAARAAPAATTAPPGIAAPAGGAAAPTAATFWRRTAPVNPDTAPGGISRFDAGMQ